MKMSITLSNFPMSRLSRFIQEVNKYAQCAIEVEGEDTVLVSCEADMVKCQEVVIISDLYWSGGELNDEEETS